MFKKKMKGTQVPFTSYLRFCLRAYSTVIAPMSSSKKTIDMSNQNIAHKAH